MQLHRDPQHVKLATNGLIEALRAANRAGAFDLDEAAAAHNSLAVVTQALKVYVTALEKKQAALAVVEEEDDGNAGQSD